MEQGTFSRAAIAMRISQPTVSQHIARLEAVLKTRLFQRVGHKVVPTLEANRLLGFSNEILDRIQDFEDQLSDNQVSARGLVRYGMPESCQWTPHYRRIMQQISKFPNTEFRIEIQPATEVAEKVLRGDLDFGFIVGERISPDLRYEKFGEESYCLVSADIGFFSSLDTKGGSNVRWVQFPGSEIFFNPWAVANRYKKSIRDRASLHIGTLAGAIHAVEEGAGIAVVPLQCVFDKINKGHLKLWKKSTAGHNDIYIVRRIGDKLPRRVEMVMELLKKAKQDIG